METTHGSPHAGDRLTAPDLAKGFMLLVIALAHAPLWLSGDGEFTLAGRPVGVTATDGIVNALGILFVDSRGLPLFAVLLGYGLSTMVDRRRNAGNTGAETRRMLRRRAVLLILFGFLNSVVIGGIDILAEYGFYTLIVGWLLFRGDRALHRAILVVASIYLVILPPIWLMMANTDDFAPTAMVNAGSGSYVETSLINAVNFPFMIVGGLFAYPMLLPVLIGIWAGRNRLLEAETLLLRRTAVTGVAVSVVGALPLAVLITSSWTVSGTTEALFTVLQMTTGLAGGIGYAAVFALIGRRTDATGSLTGGLAATGQRSLTSFLLIELSLVVILSPVGFGYGGELSVTGAAVVAVLVWLFCLMVSTALQRGGVPGPADSLLRTLTYR